MSEADWSIVPSVVLIDLYRFLSLKDRLAASSTCKRWREAFFFYPSWRKLDLTTAHCQTEKNAFLVEKFSKMCRSASITYLLEDFHEVSDILKNWTSSRRITQFQMVGSGLRYGTSFQSQFESAVLPFLENCNNLTQLILSHVTSPAKVRDVFSRFSSSLTNLAIGPVLHQEIENTTKMSGESLLRGLDNLSILQLDGSWLTSEVLMAISEHLRLQRLSIHFRNNNATVDIPASVWQHFHTKLPHCEIRVTYYRIPEGTYVLESQLLPNAPITHVRLVYCSEQFQEECLNAYMRERALLHTICSIWAISDPKRKDEFMRHPYVVCAWRFKHLREMVLSGSIFDEYDLVGMARMRSCLRVHIARDDIAIGDGSQQSRPITQSELNQLKQALRPPKGEPWSPMDENRFNDPKLPYRDREAQALRQVYLDDFKSNVNRLGCV